MNSNLIVKQQGHISTITLNRAAKGNALSTDMLTELEAIALGFADDEYTRAVIIRAEGANFSFGMDLDEMMSMI